MIQSKIFLNGPLLIYFFKSLQLQEILIPQVAFFLTGN